MTEPLPPQIVADIPVARKRSKWTMPLLTLLAIVMLLVALYLPFGIRYRQQWEAIAVIERLGGSVFTRSDAPEWLQRLQPDQFFGRLEGLGPNWLRERLPAETIVNHFVVVEEVGADHGPGLRLHTNFSGQRVDVDSIQVTDEDLVYISRFTQLERLYLRNMQISDAGFAQLRNLRHLRVIYLSYTQITDESAEVLAGFERLETLRLVGTQITDKGLAKLTGLSHLTELDVRQTRVTKSGLDPFRGRPGLQLLGNDPDDPYHGIIISY